MEWWKILIIVVCSAVCSFPLWIIIIEIIKEEYRGCLKIKRAFKERFDHQEERKLLRAEIALPLKYLRYSSDELKEEIEKQIDSIRFKYIKETHIPRIAREIVFDSILRVIWNGTAMYDFRAVINECLNDLCDISYDGDVEEWRKVYARANKILDFTRTDEFREAKEYMLSEKAAFYR